MGRPDNPVDAINQVLIQLENVSEDWEEFTSRLEELLEKDREHLENAIDGMKQVRERVKEEGLSEEAKSEIKDVLGQERRFDSIIRSLDPEDEKLDYIVREIENSMGVLEKDQEHLLNM